MKATRMVRLEASIIIEYDRDLDGLPAELPDPDILERGMVLVTVASFRAKGGDKYKAASDAPPEPKVDGKRPEPITVNQGRYNYSLYYPKPERKVVPAKTAKRRR